MDRREMEMLMDKYKAEMLEFSRRNNISGYPQSDQPKDEREQAIDDEFEEKGTVERDRSNPLPLSSTEPQQAEEEPEPETVPAQTQPSSPMIIPNILDSEDVRQALTDGCARLPENASREQRQRCRDINDFLASNNESGTLRVETFAGDRSFGVGSARVMVFVELPSGNVAVFDGLTDNDGITQSIRLPAPPRELSQSPQTGNNARLPYSVYSVYVEHPAYVRSVFTNVPVFSGVESIQPVRMLARVEGQNEPAPVVVNEGSNSALRN